ncbi:hypothetical protein [Streptomyces echinatus]|uniref:Outer membrane biosynthesis protein TonB n=1 Tax=Streptomyces echinatus TaxID=67293 RepID=A0A7W9PNL4_9ACTN|nr:hypothetical protein [Streptomyces echinatus]MBB5924849.1 outer membrane biosynthesis protein TonB [Streptomyces echinatus]
MRKFQRVAVVAAAVAGLSALGAGVSFAGGEDEAAPRANAVATSSANAVAIGDGFYAPPQAQPEAQPEEQKQPEEHKADQPEEKKADQPEEGYGQEQHGEDD